MPAALCPAGEFPATTTLPRYAAGREDMVAVLLLFCGQAGQFLELTSNANRSSTRLLQDYFGWHGMLVDEANYGQIVRRAPCADGKCTTLASLSKQLPNSRINLMKHSQLPAASLSYLGGSRVRVDPVLGLPPTKKPAALKMTREKRLKKRAERRGELYAKAEAAEAYQHATTPPALEAANKIS